MSPTQQQAPDSVGPWARLPAVGGSLVIADLHLDAEGGPLAERFGAWTRSLRVPRLVILGDLFDSWVGPKQRRIEGTRQVLQALSALVEGGTELHVVPGNRDFWMGSDFEAATGGKVHAKGLVIEGQQGASLLVHGDELCTLDLGYQRYQRWIQSRPLRLLQSLPLPVLRWLARRLRSRSEYSVPRKPEASKRMQPEAAAAFLERAEAQTLICGHAHRYQDEDLSKGRRWLVLDAWGDARDCLEEGPGGWRSLGSDGAAANPE